MVNFRLMWFVEKHGLLDPNQFGFRRGYSTIDHVMGLSIDIHSNFYYKKHLMAIFLDLSHAYDSTWRYDILRTMYSWGFRGNLPIFISNFLSDRSFQVRLSGLLSNSYALENGLPQGSSLSPSLFLIAINSIKAYIPQQISYRLFADDIVIYHSSSNPWMSQNVLQDCLNSLGVWSSNHGFVFSPNKSSCTHFCRVRNCPRIQHFEMFDIPISTNPFWRFLGMILDSKLDWREHFKHLRSRCFKDIALLKMLAGTKWGSDTYTLLSLYRSLIRSKIDYGSQVYISSRSSYISSLETLQNMSLRLALGAFRTSPK